MPFKELSRIALLGTENTIFPDELLQELRIKGLNIKNEPPLLLAEAASLFSQIKKAGFILEEFKGELPEASTETEENSCSFKSIRHLQLILDGKYAAIFPEFLHHLLENGKRLPTDLLPSLMARDDINEWWHLIEVSLSETGKWLLAQHPKWKIRVTNPSDSLWQTGDKIQRMALFQSWRLGDPTTAIEHLQATWDSENYRDKKNFIKEMAIGLSPADESLLNLALADKRKEVRMEATHLLAKIPFSAFSERMFQRALECLFYEKGKWHFQVPEELDAATIADGILSIDPAWKGGAKAGYLGQVFSKIPPSRWELHFEAEPLEILQLFNKTDWSEVVLQALAMAAVFHGDEKWIDSFLGYWLENEKAPLWKDPVGAQILEMASPETVNQLSLKFLSAQKGLPDEESPVFQLLLANDAPWENDLTKLIISRLQEWVANTKVMDWDALHYKLFLDMASMRCSPFLFTFLEKGWRTTAPLWYNWEKLVTEMLNTVLFRREMMLELGN